MDLTVALTVDTGDFESNINDAVDAAENLGDSAEDMGDKVEESGEQADASSSLFSAFSITLANLASNAIQTVISKLGEMVQALVDTGIETETAFAKLETIAGTENIDDLSDSITTLSSQLGIAASELAETAYQAISAGTSVENTAEMVETASKLATAGFTDSTTAVDILTTAINAYGYSSEDAEAIADSLIQTQNLGKTTVDELASSMGRAIATGSAYSVSLENIEAAYVGLTSQGIDTAEATTRMASMINELGDSSSDVATIISDETGQSFSQLMASGYSLGDVLQILYDYCESDTDALANLWSSSEAGSAATALINNGLENFNDTLDQLADSAGTTEEAYSIMANTMSTKLSILKTSFQNLGLQLYDSFSPILSGIVTLLTSVVVPAVQAVLTVVTTVIDGVVTAFSWAWELIQAAWDELEPYFSEIWAAIQAIFADVPANLSEFFNEAWTAIQLIWNAVEPFFSLLWESIKAIFAVVAAVFSGNFSDAWAAIKNVFAGWSDFFTGLWDDITGIFGNIGAWFENIGKNIVEGIKTGISNAWSSLTSKLSSLLSNLVGATEDELEINSPSKVFGRIGGYMAEGLGVGWEDEFGDIQSGITADLDFGTAAASGGSSGGISVIQNIYSQAQTAADLLREARWEQERAVLRGV